MDDLEIIFGSQFKRDLKKTILFLATAEWAEPGRRRKNRPPHPKSSECEPKRASFISSPSIA